ncbi:Tfp pilus assembly protein FimT/FimU [Candidatus Margulisiibacteriota bacterium]
MLKQACPRGFFLLEMVITISVISVLVVSPLLYLPKLIDKVQCQQVCFQAYQMISLARFSAMALNEDVLIKAQDNILTLSYKDILYKSLSAPVYFVFSINGSNKQAGFKASGHSKFARTITITSKYHSRAISIGIDKGKITLK